MSQDIVVDAIEGKKPASTAQAYKNLTESGMINPHTGKQMVWKPGLGMIEMDDPQDNLKAPTGMVGADGKAVQGPNQITAPGAAQKQDQQSMGQKSRQQATDEINLQIPATRNANFRPALSLFPDKAPQELTIEERVANQNARRLDAGIKRVDKSINTDSTHMKEAIKNVAMDNVAYGNTAEALKHMGTQTKNNVGQ